MVVVVVVLVVVVVVVVSLSSMERGVIRKAEVVVLLVCPTGSCGRVVDGGELLSGAAAAVSE